MKGSQSALLVVGLEMANLALSVTGFHWPSSLSMYSMFAHITFFLGAHSLRQSFGEIGYRRIFSLFAILLLPTSKSWMVVEALPTSYRLPVELLGCAMVLAILWHFSKHLDLNQSDAGPKLFSPNN